MKIEEPKTHKRNPQVQDQGTSIPTSTSADYHLASPTLLTLTDIDTCVNKKAALHSSAALPNLAVTTAAD